jgi:hypothetical protein
MTKKFLIAAMGAAIVAGANAQAPVLTWVKSLDEPFVGSAPLSGSANPSDVTIRGNNMFYTTYSNGSIVRLIRVTNWDKPSATWEIYAEVPYSGGTRHNQVVADPTNANRLWWMTSGGQSSGVTPVIYRVKADGTALTDWKDLGTDALADGEISNTEIQIANSPNWGATTTNSFWISFDPGFGPSPEPALIAGTRGSYVFRRINVDTGRMLTNSGILVPKAGWLLNTYRDVSFDASGNAWAKCNNNIYFQQRTEQSQPKIPSNSPSVVPAEYIAGFAGQTLIPATSLGTNTGFTESLSNIVYVPGTASSDPFILANNRSGVSGTNRLCVIPTTGGASYVNLTGGFNAAGAPLPFSDGAQIQGFDYGDINGQRYVFAAGFKSSVQGVDIYQLGTDGRISGTVTLEGWAGNGVNFLSQPFKVEVQDLSGNVLDRRNFQGGATPTTVDFYTTARGDVNIIIAATNYVEVTTPENISRPDTFLTRKITTNIGAASTSVTTTLLNGDVDQDTEVGPGDFEAVVSAFGAPYGDPAYVAAADLDKDGEVGPADFELVVNNFGLGDE